jgi:hypothetical protein
MQSITKFPLLKSSLVRSMQTTTRLFDIFKVQNQKDFTDKVINVKDFPIIIDFFATYVIV